MMISIIGIITGIIGMICSKWHHWSIIMGIIIGTRGIITGIITGIIGLIIGIIGIML